MKKLASRRPAAGGLQNSGSAPNNEKLRKQREKKEMKTPKRNNRRRFIRNVALIASTAAVAGKAGAQPALVPLNESDPLAIALGYSEDALTVDVAKYPKRSGEEGAKQFCSNCALYKDNGSPGRGACAATPGKSVAGAGWCTVWAPKP